MGLRSIGTKKNVDPTIMVAISGLQQCKLGAPTGKLRLPMLDPQENYSCQCETHRKTTVANASGGVVMWNPDITPVSNIHPII